LQQEDIDLYYQNVDIQTTMNRIQKLSDMFVLYARGAFLGIQQGELLQ
jgi:hypothetical protein